MASARVTSPIDDWQLVRALNAHLPEAIRVTELTHGAGRVFMRGSARPSKTYEYRIWNGRTVPPFIRQYAWHIIEPLNLPLMQEASRAIVGEHDFAAFRSARSMNHTTVRAITAVVAARRTEQTLVFEIARQGVSPLHGAEPGRHARRDRPRGSGRVGDMARLLAAPDRSRPAGPPRRAGLFLMKVDY